MRGASMEHGTYNMLGQINMGVTRRLNRHYQSRRHGTSYLYYDFIRVNNSVYFRPRKRKVRISLASFMRVVVNLLIPVGTGSFLIDCSGVLFLSSYNRLTNNYDIQMSYYTDYDPQADRITYKTVTIFSVPAKEVPTQWGTVIHEIPQGTYNIDFNVINRGYFNAFRHKPTMPEYLPQITNSTPSVSALNCVLEVEFYGKPLNVRR